MADEITEPKTDVPQPEPVIPEYNTEFPLLGTPLDQHSLWQVGRQGKAGF